MKSFKPSSVLAILLAAPFLAAGISAAVCDNTYYMQTGSVVTLTGPAANNLTQVSRTTVGKDMGGVEILHSETEYDVINRFEGNGACTEWKKTKVDFSQRKKGSNNFSMVSTVDNYIKLHGTPYPNSLSTDFHYWFGFASSLRGDTAYLFNAIGKLKSETKPYVWYGTALMTRNVKDAVLGTPIGTRVHYLLSLRNHPDSAALQNELLNVWKDYKNNDTQTVSFKVQLIKVVYDSVPPATGIRGRGGLAGSKARDAGFEATQSGNLVLIRPADGKVAPSEALGLYNMLGHKVATLHPTGYLYQWNGRTSSGAQAQTGVYFVQSNSRILGKFFYTH